MKTIACKKCATQIDELDAFPGQICIDCHAKKFDDDMAKGIDRLGTAQDIANNFKRAIRR